MTNPSLKHTPAELAVDDETPPPPNWTREIDLAITVHPQIILTGNVRDMYKLNDPAIGQPWYMPLDRAIWSLLEPHGYAALLSYSAGTGLAVVGPEDEEPAELTAVLAAVQGVRRGEHLTWDLLRHLLQALAPDTPSPNTRPLAIMLPDIGRLLSKDDSNDQERLFLSAIDQHAYRTVRVGSVYPVIFWIVDVVNDLPAWFTSGNHTLRTTTIPEPDLSARHAVAQDMVFRFPPISTNPNQAAAFADQLAGSTHGLHTRSMLDITQMAVTAGIGGADITDAVRAYRVGIPDNPWASPALRNRIREEVQALENSAADADVMQGRSEPALVRRVLGQPEAIRRVLDILTRSVVGLGGAHRRGGSSRPRGVLFFAGPTGVGKTELAKGIASVVFGDEAAYLRFDMSEFAAEQNEARLIGAPPGFVGFDSGGELTNGVRSRPFQVILFDELEKAHPRILDKFLQILDEGRLTDGRGATVHFTETILVFTTNLGIVVPGSDGQPPRENVIFGDSSVQVDTKVRSYIEKFFRETLGRPELYNRLREGIVVFDFLRPPVPEQIAASSIDLVLASATRRFGVPVTITPACRARLVAEITNAGNTHNGGRGIVSAMETVLVNPLARALFGAPGRDAAVITGLTQHGQNWQVELE